MLHAMPVTPAAKKWLEHWMKSPYHATQSSMIGMWLINAITRKTTQVREYKKPCIGNRHEFEFHKKYGFLDTWKFTAPKRYMDNVVLPSRRVVQFNNMILKFMYSEIFHNMEKLRVSGEMFYIQVTINAFRDKYGVMDNEFEDERVRKAYLRYREKSDSLSEYSDFFTSTLLLY